MVIRSFVKCDVCNSVIVVRTQIGWLDEHPIRIHCGKCNTLIKGKCSIDQENAGYNIEFNDCDVLLYEEGMHIDFYIEVSGELLTAKIRPYNKGNDEYLPSPYLNSFRAMDIYGDESFLEFNKNMNQFIDFIKHDWSFIRRIHDLWLDGKQNYLSDQMRNHLTKELYPLDSEFENLRGLHQLFLNGFQPVLPASFYDKISPKIFESLRSLTQPDPSEYKKLVAFFDTNGLFHEYEYKIFRILNDFVDKYLFFVTASGVELYTNPIDLNMEGTASVTFDDIRHFYLDCYETIGDLVTLVIAYNNLKYRGSYQIMDGAIIPSIKSLDDVINKMSNKGNKLKFCETDEFFNELIELESDNDLRNAIGHGSWKYDGMNQIVTFYSSGSIGKGTEQKIYLIEFILKTLRQFKSILILSELLYQTRKLSYVYKGAITAIPSYYNKIASPQFNNVSKNSLCPCGSGKKYKRCHGKVNDSSEDN